MKILFLILNWMFGVFFLLFFTVSIATGYILTAIPFFIIAAILLPPVRSKVNQKTNWKISIEQRKATILTLIIISLFFLFLDVNRVIKNEKIRKEVAYVEMLKKQKKELANEFNKNREIILSKVNESINSREYNKAIELSAKYAKINNQELISLGNQAQEEYRQHIILKEKNTILAQLKETTEINYNKKLNLYVRLRSLNPDNKIYQTKAEYYADKIKIRDEKKAKNIQKTNKQLKLKEEKQKRERMLTEIKYFCADKWKEDYTMVKYCRDKQNKSFERMMKRRETRKELEIGGSPYGRILINCMKKWQVSAYSYDWTMVEYCNKNQTDAYLETRN